MIKSKIKKIIISLAIILFFNVKTQAEDIISKISVHNVKRISNEAFMDH
ncbi:MAG: hypothetical protein RL208_685, partial [Pseudomonadota bacterium]